MPDHVGPADNSIRKLIEFTAAHRGAAYRNWSDVERKEFRELIRNLEAFVFKVGYFATANQQVVDAAYDGVICDLRSRLGKISWLSSLPWIMKVISRGRTMSGWMFQELRVRIQIITTNGPVLPDSSLPEETVRENLRDVADALVPLRQEHNSCELKDNKRNKQLEKQGYCGRGCDVLLLAKLGFTPVLIGRVLGGFKEGVTRNRIASCESKRLDLQFRWAKLNQAKKVKTVRA